MLYDVSKTGLRIGLSARSVQNALTIDPGKPDGGRYLITLQVTDPAIGAVVLAEREFPTR